MSRNDDGFNLDDMMEIFGDAVPAAAKTPVATQAPPTAPPPAAPAKEDLSLSADELALLEAYEKQKQEKRQRDEEAKRKKDEEAKRILEDYERAQRETQEKEARARVEAEAKRQKELENLKRKEEFKLDADRMAEEERKIIEEFEREAAVQKLKQDEDRQFKEAAAQAELQRLAEQQRAEESKRQAESAAKDAEFQAQAQAVSKKDSRLLELLAKAQNEIQATGLPPLPGGGIAPLAAAAPSGGPSAADILIDIEQKQNDAFCNMVDETRKAMFTFLAPLIGIKASNNMLNKSVEKARAKAPVVLKDANWKMDGSLREDGSVDPERLLKNAGLLPAGTRVDDYLAGLHELISIRFKAVEAGLGGTTAGEMKNRVLASREAIKAKKFDPAWVDLFFNRVVG